jgi:hypothetical protein
MLMVIAERSKTRVFLVNSGTLRHMYLNQFWGTHFTPDDIFIQYVLGRRIQRVSSTLPDSLEHYTGSKGKHLQ